MASESEPSLTLRVENVPLRTEDTALEELFCDYGPIKRCFVVKPKKKGAKKTIGYVQFNSEEDAKTAHEESNKKGLQLDEVDLKVKFAPDKGSLCSGSSGGDDVKKERDVQQREFDKAAAKEKKARLIVRNLSFKATEESLTKHFEQEGLKGQKNPRKIVDCKILKKPDGKMVGCGFVQFSNVSEAVDAIKQLNGKHYIGRPVAVDWAVAKKDYDRQKQDVKKEIKEEVKEELEEEIKEEPEDEVEEEEEGDDDEEEEEEETTPQKPVYQTGHDINENKTVFVRNLSFDSDEDDLKAMLEENFGSVLFAKMVVNKETGNPKGTAFVKFSEESHAYECTKVSDGSDGIYLDGRRIYCLPAIGKESADETAKLKKERRAKDSRNLYLSREGLVREGTLAAEGVSKEDMTKRNQLNKWKKGILKDLNMFLSPTRLCFRNLPPHINDKSLRTLVKKHSEDANARITECKVMRDFKTINKIKGEPASKGYAFITFTNHESALNALRKMNNNPNVFNKNQRPIIEFSVENRKALLARQKRLEKSIEKNPLNKNNSAKADGKRGVVPAHNKPNKKVEVEEKEAFMGAINDPNVKNLPTHDGPKIRHKERAISRKDIKKREKERKNLKKRKRGQDDENKPSTSNQDSSSNLVSPSPSKKPKAEKKAKKKKPKTKSEIADLKEDKKFNDLVNSYKSKLVDNAGIPVKSKWFDS